MVHLRGMVHEGWYMVQESKLWYDYIIMVRLHNYGTVCQRCSRVMPVLPNNSVLSVGTALGRYWLYTGAVLLF